MNARTKAALLALAAPLLALAEPPISEISVDMSLDEVEIVVGEKVRAVIDVKNMSPDVVTVDGTASSDMLLVEVFKASTKEQLDRTRQAPFVSPFRIRKNEGQLLETFLNNHYFLREPRRYLARPVLVHNGIRYEGQYRAFDVVPGMKISRALQMFANRKGLNREFELLQWTRRGREHLFLSARDEGAGSRKWQTTDLGGMVKRTPPTISILPTGEVIVIHRADNDFFLRSEFWSLPNALEFRGNELIRDPETAGQSSVQEMYRKAGGVKAEPRPWWKFW
ncbi:MAG: hypothetical protein J6U17_05760 [Kiritimatiellae bacterium]|nr:hypothetical protein [Kiritimatiellia bacterium]